MLIEYKNHKIFAFSDTHGLNHRLDIPKDADILICAGDCLKEDNMRYHLPLYCWKTVASSLMASVSMEQPVGHGCLKVLRIKCLRM